MLKGKPQYVNVIVKVVEYRSIVMDKSLFTSEDGIVDVVDMADVAVSRVTSGHYVNYDRTEESAEVVEMEAVEDDEFPFDMKQSDFI